MGASCGFRVFDEDGLAARVVKAANRRGNFPNMYADVWMHFSLDTEEIASFLYGQWVFGGFVTRIELQQDKLGRAVAKVWGGYQGIAVSKIRSDTTSAS